MFCFTKYVCKLFTLSVVVPRVRGGDVVSGSLLAKLLPYLDRFFSRLLAVFDGKPLKVNNRCRQTIIRGQSPHFSNWCPRNGRLRRFKPIVSSDILRLFRSCAASGRIQSVRCCRKARICSRFQPRDDILLLGLALHFSV